METRKVLTMKELKDVFEFLGAFNHVVVDKAKESYKNCMASRPLNAKKVTVKKNKKTGNKVVYAKF